MVYLLMAVGRVSELVPGLDAIPQSKIIVALWVIALFAEQKSRTASTRPGLLSSPPLKAGLFLLALAYVTALYSIQPGYTARQLISVAIVLPMTVVLTVLTLNTWARIRAAMISLVVAGVMLTTLAIARTESGRIFVGYSMDTNDLAYLLVTIMPLAWALFLCSTGWIRHIYLGACALMIAGVLLSQSRGGFLALLCQLLFLTWVWSRMRTTSTGLRSIGRLVMAISALAIVGAVSWPLVPDEARTRLTSLFNLSSDYNLDRSGKKGRTVTWERNMRALSQRPIGFGFATSPAADIRAGGVYQALHNSLLEIAVELGFLGLIIYIRVFGTSWIWLVRAEAASPRAGPLELRPYFQCLRASLVGTLVAGFFLSQAYSNISWILVAMITATMFSLGIPYKASAAPSSSPARRQRRPQGRRTNPASRHQVS
jgi:hypothetical protein